MIYKFIDSSEQEITVSSLSSLQTLVDSETIKKNTKIKAGLRGKWVKAESVEGLNFEEKKAEETPKEETEDIVDIITRTPEPTPPPKVTEKFKKEKIVETEKSKKEFAKEEKITETEPVEKETEDTLSEEPDKEEKSEEPEKKKAFFIKVLWRGDYSLGLSYWAFYQLPGFFLSLFAVAGEESALGPSATTGFFFFYLIAVWLGIFYVIIAMVGSWKSATKYKKEKISKNLSYGWAIAAYITIALGGLSMAVEFIREIVSPSI